MMIFRLATGFSLMAFLIGLGAEAALAAKPPVGQYSCTAYGGNPPTASQVGVFFIQPNNVYEVKDHPVTGKYNFDDARQLITWAGEPPFGFEVGVVEQPDRYSPPRVRLYPKSQDIGNVWKAATCYFQAVGKGGGSAASVPAGGPTSYTVGARVYVLYQGELLPAVISGVDTGRYTVRYEPNRYGFRTDSITSSRLKPRS